MSGFTFDDPTGTSSYSQSGSTIRISSGPKTDYWTTAPGSVPESSAHRASAPVLYQLHKLSPTANWRLKGTLHQPGTERFQQTTLFLRRVDPNEGANGEGQKWLKSGIEIEQGRQFIGVVVSDPFSDWNVAPLANAPGKDAAKVDVEIEKVGPDVHVYYTPAGEKSRILLREKKGFAPPTDAEHETWWLGAMVCGPLSESTEGTVENWTFEPITDAQH